MGRVTATPLSWLFVDFSRHLLHYQPIVELETGRCAGYEALARLNSGPVILPPIEFVRDIIGSSDELEWISHQLVMVNTALKTIDEDKFVSFNLSGESLYLPGLVDVFNALNPEPERTWLEISEAASVDLDGESLATLLALQQRKHSLKIDDFGEVNAGFQRLLQHHPAFEGVKIGMSLTKGCSGDDEAAPRKCAIIAGVVAIAAQLKPQMSVCAEGLDNPADVEMCKALGVGLGQGYYFGRPMPLSKLGTKKPLIQGLHTP